MQDPNKKPSRKVAEAAFSEMAMRLGWGVSKRGWPDFFLSCDGRPFCVEIRSETRRRLRKDQQVVMERLAEHGIPCYRWSPSGGFEPVGSSPPFEDFKSGAQVGGERGGSGFKEEVTTTTTPLLERGSGGKPFDSQEKVRRQVDEIWAHYVRVMKPRQALASDEERAVIRKALKVASVDDCKIAISACAASEYHMKEGVHANRKGGKYNKLSHILKGRRGKETTRERIDWWLDRAGERVFTSADPATVARHQQQVQRGHRFQGDQEMMERAERSEAWLREHGIETIRRESDAYPTFGPLREEA